MTHAHASHRKDDGVQVDDASGEQDEHGVAHPRHEEQEGHLAPPEAQQAEEDPDRGGHNVANREAGAGRVQPIAIDCSQRVTKQ